MLSSVLYPYVYLTTRIVFLMQGRNIADVARTLGARPAKVFWRVLLPVARPAIIAGVALVLMETINDIGAAEYLGVRTLTVAVYATWLARGSLEGGAQIALLMLALVFLILAAEQWARQRRRFHTGRATHMKAHPPRVALKGFRAPLATILTALPVLFGFGIPILVFGQYALRRLDQFASPALADAFLNSLMTAGCTALLTVVLALFLLNAVRLARSHDVTATVRLASIGYALPGGISGARAAVRAGALRQHDRRVFPHLVRPFDRAAADRLGGGRHPRLHDPLRGACGRRDPLRAGEAAGAS